MGCIKFDTAHFILYIFTLYSVLCWLRPSCYRSLCNYKHVCITLTYSQLSLYSVLCTLYSVICNLFSLLVQQEYARNLG